MQRSVPGGAWRSSGSRRSSPRPISSHPSRRCGCSCRRSRIRHDAASHSRGRRRAGVRRRDRQTARGQCTDCAGRQYRAVGGFPAHAARGECIGRTCARARDLSRHCCRPRAQCLDVRGACHCFHACGIAVVGGGRVVRPQGAAAWRRARPVLDMLDAIGSFENIVPGQGRARARRTPDGLWPSRLPRTRPARRRPQGNRFGVAWRPEPHPLCRSGGSGGARAARPAPAWTASRYQCRILYGPGARGTRHSPRQLHERLRDGPHGRMDGARPRAGADRSADPAAVALYRTGAEATAGGHDSRGRVRSGSCTARRRARAAPSASGRARGRTCAPGSARSGSAPRRSGGRRR